MNGYIVLVAVMLVVCAMACMLLSHHISKKMEVTYQNLLQRLDRAIGGEVQDTTYDESMDAAVVAKIVIPRLLHIVNPEIAADDVVSVKIWVFLLGGCFAFLTNLMSCKNRQRWRETALRLKLSDIRLVQVREKIADGKAAGSIRWRYRICSGIKNRQLLFLHPL